MFSVEDIKTMEIVDKHVSDMNALIKYPYFFSWSLPTNHVHKDSARMSHFCVNLGKYLIQETADNIERCTPVEVLYFFGRINNLASCTVPDNIADHWNETFTSIVYKNYLALDCAARGYHNINNSEYPVNAQAKVENIEFCKKDDKE
jgi:hypothetical protein